MKRSTYATTLLIVVVDQISKAWALNQLSGRGVEPFLPGLLQLRLVFNTGAAFSMLEGNSLGLGLVSALVALGLVLWIQSSNALSRWQSLGLGLLLGGAIGNGIDRFRIGRVVDFLDLVPIQFPVFNVADVAINAAVVCLLIDLLQQRTARHERRSP